MLFLVRLTAVSVPSSPPPSRRCPENPPEQRIYWIIIGYRSQIHFHSAAADEVKIINMSSLIFIWIGQSDWMAESMSLPHVCPKESLDWTQTLRFKKRRRGLRERN